MTKRYKLTNSKRLYLAAQQKYRCAICKDVLGAVFHADHIKPLWKWDEEDHAAANALSNIQILDQKCHQTKSDRELFQYQDLMEEKRTRLSRFFNPMSLSYMENIDKLEGFRYMKKKKKKREDKKKIHDNKEMKKTRSQYHKLMGHSKYASGKVHRYRAY